MNPPQRPTFDPAPLLSAEAYPHAVAEIRLVETHMSWVFLTGDYVYKLKKPVRFAFADFSDAGVRRHLCEEELRLNRQFAPHLYLAVVPIVVDEDCQLRIGEPGESAQAIEWAVKMRQFDTAMQADNLLRDGQLHAGELRVFGATLARQHAAVAVYEGPYDPAGPMWENFDSIDATGVAPADVLARLRTELADRLESLEQTLIARQSQGFVRECHGDLHLSNMVRLDDGLHGFDCLEFSPELRNIDCICDAAFLIMDCLVRRQPGLAYAFLDGYLNHTGDYRGAALLPMFVAYRSMVRAKVAALRLQQEPTDPSAGTKLSQHLQFCLDRAQRSPGRLLIMCGVSGTGKSYWAQQLCEALGAIRIRSDVLRKVRSGIGVAARTDAGIGDGIYTPDRSSQLYAEMAQCASDLLAAGESVIIDAASLQPEQRQTLYRAGADAGAGTQVLYLTAPRLLLEQRIEQRNQAGEDPSEADASVLAWQLANHRPPGADEPVIEADTRQIDLQSLLARITADPP